MRFAPRQILQAVTLVAVAALLGACCNFGRAGTWPAHEETDHPDIHTDAQGRTQHWHHNNNWIRHHYYR